MRERLMGFLALTDIRPTSSRRSWSRPGWQAMGMASGPLRAGAHLPSRPGRSDRRTWSAGCRAWSSRDSGTVPGSACRWCSSVDASRPNGSGVPARAGSRADSGAVVTTTVAAPDLTWPRGTAGRPGSPVTTGRRTTGAPCRSRRATPPCVRSTPCAGWPTTSSTRRRPLRATTSPGRRHSLTAFRDEVGTVLDGGPTDDPVLAAIGDSFARCTRSRVRTWTGSSGRWPRTSRRRPTRRGTTSLHGGSAAVIGEMMLPVLRPRSPEAFEPARALGFAFQLTNFLRDVGEDLDRGRVYIPQEDLRRSARIRGRAR